VNIASRCDCNKYGINDAQSRDRASRYPTTLLSLSD